MRRVKPVATPEVGGNITPVDPAPHVEEKDSVVTTDEV